MFDLLRAKMFHAKVQAELMAQHRDQEFTNRLCHQPESIQYIYFMWKNAYFKGQKIGPFMVVCGLLGNALSASTLAFEDRMLCAGLLAQRITKVNTNRSFKHDHILLFGELETKLLEWMEEHPMAKV